MSIIKVCWFADQCRGHEVDVQCQVDGTTDQGEERQSENHVSEWQEDHLQGVLSEPLRQAEDGREHRESRLVVPRGGAAARAVVIARLIFAVSRLTAERGHQKVNKSTTISEMGR